MPAGSYNNEAQGVRTSNLAIDGAFVLSRVYNQRYESQPG